MFAQQNYDAPKLEQTFDAVHKASGCIRGRGSLSRMDAWPMWGKQSIEYASEDGGIDTCFAAGEVDEIWITFPDPQPQKTRVRNRLTNMMFVNRYRNILQPDGLIHLKTDNEPFYDFTREVITENKLQLLDATNDLYADTTQRDEALTSIKTYYEKKFSDLGFKICYLKFKV